MKIPRFIPPTLRGTLDAIAKRGMIFLACVRRGRLGSTAFIGITGSGAKTTTRHLIEAILRSRLSGVASRLSKNREGELARTILRAKKGHAFCLQEIGAIHPGSLDEMLAVFRPTIGVVTHVSLEHLSSFKTIDAVAQEKEKLIACLPAGGVAILNADDPMVAAMAKQTSARVVFYGLSATASVRAVDVSARWPDRLSFNLEFNNERFPVQTRLCGAHWIHAVLAAIATALQLGLSPAEIIRTLAIVEPVEGRMSPCEIGGVTFIRDDWKSPSWHMPAVLQFLRDARASRRVLVLGHIADDNTKPRRLYADVAREARQVCEQVVMIGRWAMHGLKARAGESDASVVAFETLREAHEYLGHFLRSGDLVMIKAASTADHAERLVFARNSPVTCWRTHCGVITFCNECPKLYAPYDPACDDTSVN